MNINIIDYGYINIKIYDNKCNLLIDKNIINNAFFDLKKGIYILKIFYKYNILGTFILLHKNNIDYYNIKLIINNDIKTFNLYDYYYKGLKIKRGELIIGT